MLVQYFAFSPALWILCRLMDSYKWYVQHTDISTDGHLNLYTADMLTKYFDSELKPDYVEAREAVRQHVRNYQTSLAAVKKNAQAELIQQLDLLVETYLEDIISFRDQQDFTNF